MARLGLFAFGSLSEGMVHYKLIESRIVGSQPARARGRVYKLQVGYPVVIEGDDQWVDGFLYDLEDDGTLLDRLDQIHEVDFKRPERGTHYRSRLESDAGFIYYYNPKKLTKYMEPVRDGNWQRVLSEQPALKERFTPQQRAYIKRLGTSSRREIIPIDIQLYRQLMGMELIEDKGRRLALSKFGKEVFRYLD